MAGQAKIGNNHRKILAALYEYSKRYPNHWVPHHRLVDELNMNETVFSSAIQFLVETRDGGYDLDSLVEMTHSSIAYREYQGGVIPLPDNATMSDALFAVKYTWYSNHSSPHFYRITNLGVERLNNLTT